MTGEHLHLRLWFRAEKQLVMATTHLLQLLLCVVLLEAAVFSLGLRRIHVPRVLRVLVLRVPVMLLLLLLAHAFKL